MNSYDARVRYTRMIIEQCFLELLRDKPVSKVTVTELCEKARINRATFYKHYLDIPDLLEKLEADLFRQIREMFGDPAEDIESRLLDMLHYTRREGQRFMTLGSDNGDPDLMRKSFLIYCDIAYPLVKRSMPELPEKKLQMLVQFMTQGGSGILTWWIRGGMLEEPEEIGRYIIDLCSAVMKGLEM